MKSSNCPICNKGGLHDYKTSHIVCPQCNSDLKSFLLLHSIAKRNSINKYIFWSIGLFLGTLIFVAFYFNSLSVNKLIISNELNSIIQLQDSIQKLKKAIAKSQATQTKYPEKEIVIVYKVQKNDCTSKIAHFFYNDWRMYKKIEADNNLHQPYILIEEQILTIKLIPKW